LTKQPAVLVGQNQLLAYYPGAGAYLAAKNADHYESDGKMRQA